jgi:hypothetical protein
MMLWDGIAQSVKRLATGWTVWGSNPDKGEILRTRPDRPWGPSTLLYNGQRVSYPGVKRPGYDVDHPPPPIAEVKERVELLLQLPFVPSWQVMRWASPCISCSKALLSAGNEPLTCSSRCASGHSLQLLSEEAIGYRTHALSWRSEGNFSDSVSRRKGSIQQNPAGM